MARRLRDVMTSNPVCMDKQSSVQQAAQRMRDDGIGDILVTEGERVCGIITDRDIVVRGVANDKNLSQMKLDELCSHDLVSMQPDQGVDEAVQLMQQRAVRRIPILEGESPVGVVSIGDLAVELDRDSALGDISAAPPNV